MPNSLPEVGDAHERGSVLSLSAMEFVEGLVVVSVRSCNLLHRLLLSNHQSCEGQGACFHVPLASAGQMEVGNVSAERRRKLVLLVMAAQ